MTAAVMAAALAVALGVGRAAVTGVEMVVALGVATAVVERAAAKAVV